MNKLLMKKNLIISVAVLLLALTLIPMGILGWFAVNDKNASDNFDVGVIGASVKGTLDIVLNGSTPSSSISTGTILPGEYLYADVTIENTTSSPKLYQIDIDRTAVLYPTSVRGFFYQESYVNCQDYYYNNVLLDTDNLISEATFRNFVSPVTNALQCAIYYNEGVGFDDSYVPQYFTQSGTASSLDLLSDVYVDYVPYLSYIPLSNKKAVDGQITLGDGSIIIEEGVIWQNGNIILDGGIRFTLYLVLYFSETAYVSSDITLNEEVKNVELRNSNPYIKQSFSITLSIDNE